MNLVDVLQIKFPNIILNANGNCSLHDNGDGNIYIGKWELSEPRPTAEDLASWMSDPNILIQHLKNQVIETRKMSYPPINEQLDMLYHDMKDGTSNWTNTISNIKADLPLPSQFKSLDDAIPVALSLEVDNISDIPSKG